MTLIWVRHLIWISSLQFKFLKKWTHQEGSNSVSVEFRFISLTVRKSDIVTFLSVNLINLNSIETEFEPCWWVHFWRKSNFRLEIQIKYMTQIKDMILRTLDYEWFIVEIHVVTLLKSNMIWAISCLNGRILISKTDSFHYR